MLTSDSRDYELIDRLAEEFAERFRKGERPSLQEYCDKYPHIADDLREMLPALAEVEHVKDEVQAPPAIEIPKLRQIGEYSILREVGRGGMGVVYEAEQVTLGRRVALKVLAGGKSGHGLERFKREARAAARLHHTNIVPVFGVGDHEGLPYYVMQFIQGLGVDEVLEEVKRLQALSGAPVPPSSVSAKVPRKDISAAAVARSLVTGTFEPPPEAIAETLTHAGVVGRIGNPTYDAETNSGKSSHSSSSSISLPGQSTISGRKPTYWQSVAQIGLQVADALDYAHKQGILHRDIKPSNLLLDLHGVVWVTDFGLAKSDDQENLTHTGDVLGTLRYMPPEAFEGKNDARSDVYSLGLSIYELLALRPAYDERKKEQLVKQVTTTDPPRLASLNKSIPRDLQTIVHKAIEKDPDHRYKSAADLAADLRRFLGDQTILARRVSPTERFTRWCRRNPTVAGLTAAVFLLLTSVAVVSSILAVRIEQKAREAQDEAQQKELARANEARERERADGESQRKDLALEDAAKEKRRSEELIGEQFVNRGAGLLADGDIAGAALCYAQGLKLDANNPERALTHRIRLAAALRDAPRPRHALFHDARVICAVPSADGKLLVTGCEDRTVHVWDLATGERVGSPLKVKDDIDYVNFAAGNKRLWVLTKPAPAEIDPDDDPPPENSKFEASLWDRETGEIVVSGKRNYGTAFAHVDPITKKGVVVFNPEPNVMETRDRDTGVLTRPATRLPSPITFATGSFKANREIVTTRVEAKPVEPKAGEPKAKSPRRIVYHYEFRVYDDRTGNLVFQTTPSPRNEAFVCGTDDRMLVLEEADSGAYQWYDLATGHKGPRFVPPAVPGLPATNPLGYPIIPTSPGARPTAPPTVAVTGDHRRLVIFYSSPSRTRINGRPSSLPPVIVLDADTGKEVTAPFTLTPGTSTATTTVAPNIDASRFLVKHGSSQLLRADGTPLLEQPDASAGPVVGFSPDGGFFTTVGIDNMARVWDVWTGKPVTPKLPHDAPVRIISFTPDGSHIWTISGSVVRLWPLARADQGRGLRLANSSMQRVLSDDGKRILEYPQSRFLGDEVRVIDSATGQTVAGPIRLSADDEQSSRITTAQFRSDGRAALFVIREPNPDGFGVSASRAVLWDCDSGKLKEFWTFGTGRNGIADFSPDGRFVRANMSEEDYRMRLWDAVTGEPVGDGVAVPGPKQGRSKMGTFAAPALVRGAWSPDSSILVYPHAAENTLHLCDARTGAELGPPIVHYDYLNVQWAFSDDSTRLLTTEAALRTYKLDAPLPSRDAATGRIRLWDARSGKVIGSPLTGSTLNGVIVSATLNPAGDRVAAIVAAPFNAQSTRTPRDASNGLAVYLWDPMAGRLVAPPLIHDDQPAFRLGFSPDGQWLLTATTRYIRLWSTSTGELLRAFPTSDTIADAEFSQDGRRIIVTMGTQSGPPPTQRSIVQVWDSRTGQPMTPPLRNFTQRGPGAGGPGAGPVPQRGHRSRNADRLLVSRDDGTAEVYSLAGDDRPAAELLVLTEILSARQVNTAGVIQGMGPTGFRTSWEAVRPRFASEWSSPPIEGSDWDRMCSPPALAARGTLPVGGFRFSTASERDRTGQYLWHLDRLVLSDPNDAAVHAVRGRSLVTRGDFAAAEAEFTRAIELKPNDRRPILLARANVRAELGKWAEAEADLEENLSMPPPKKAGLPITGRGDSARTALALLHLRRGDLDAYKADCAKLMTDLPPKSPFTGASSLRIRLMWPALLMDGAVPNLKELLRDEDPDPYSFAGATGAMTPQLGQYYRLERYEDVEKIFPNAFSPSRADHYFLAMAQHKQGKAEARATLEKANAMKAETLPLGEDLSGFGFSLSGQPTGTWQRQVVEDVLRKEAEGLILGKK